MQSPDRARGLRITLLLLLALANDALHIRPVQALHIGLGTQVMHPRSHLILAAADEVPTAKWTLAKIRAFISDNGLDIKTSGPGRTKAVIISDIQGAVTAVPAPKVQQEPPPPAAEVEEAAEVESEVVEPAGVQAQAAAVAAEAAARAVAEAEATAAEEAVEAAEAAQVAAVTATAEAEAATKEDVPEFWRRKDWRYKTPSGGDTVPGFHYG